MYATKRFELIGHYMTHAPLEVGIQIHAKGKLQSSSLK